jgi:hypothetical protein
MREVAPALAGGMHKINMMASNAARDVFVITAPQCDVRLAFAMRSPCQAGCARQGAGNARIFPIEALAAGGPARARMTRAVNFAGVFTGH